MSFHLSQKSLDKLVGVKPQLVQVVKLAIDYTTVDFGVTCGLRTIEEQKQLVESGASQTMNSKHITGDAVDLMAYVGDRGSWELNLYDDIAKAMQLAAKEVGVKIRWGGCWIVPDICSWTDGMDDAMNHYVDDCRQKGKRPFIDAPHFELA